LMDGVGSRPGERKEKKEKTLSVSFA
jgi:hypothetical protein